MLINLHQGAFERLQDFNGLTVAQLRKKYKKITGSDHPLTKEQCEYFYSGGNVANRAVGVVLCGDFIKINAVYPGIFCTKKQKNVLPQTLAQQLDIVNFIADSFTLNGTRPQAKGIQGNLRPTNTQDFRDNVQKRHGTVEGIIEQYNTMLVEIERLGEKYLATDDGPSELHDKKQVPGTIRVHRAARVADDQEQTMRHEVAEAWLKTIRVTRYPSPTTRLDWLTQHTKLYLPLSS